MDPECKLLDLEVDLERLRFDTLKLDSEFIRKDCHLKQWQALALRNSDGDLGVYGLRLYQVLARGRLKPCQDTVWMEKLDYIPKLIKEIEEKYATRAGLIRLSKLSKQKTIPDHKDGVYFNSKDGNICRMHIPIFSNPEVMFWIEDTPYHMEQGKLYYTDVSKMHRVVNGSDQDRIHLLIDLEATPELTKIIYES